MATTVPGMAGFVPPFGAMAFIAGSIESVVHSQVCISEGVTAEIAKLQI